MLDLRTDVHYQVVINLCVLDRWFSGRSEMLIIISEVSSICGFEYIDVYCGPWIGGGEGH